MAKGERPTFATIAIMFMIGSGIATLGIGFYLLIFGGSNLIGILILWMLGFTYAYGGWALQKDESWGWGAGVFGGIAFLVFGAFIHPIVLVLMGVAILVIALLVQSRRYYGVKRVDPGEEERQKTELKAQRMANPNGLHCPRCGSTALWISADGSAFCESCKVGTISIRPPA